MQPWLKLWPKRIFTLGFLGLSPAARATYLTAFLIAHECNEERVAMTADMLAIHTGLPIQRQRLVLRELAERRFVALDGEVVRLPLYHEMQRPKSNAERQQNWRKRNGSVTLFSNDGSNDNRNAESNGERDEKVTTEEQKIEHLRTPDTSYPPYSGGRDALRGADPEKWSKRVRDESDALLGLDLSALSPAQRFAVARRHALDFASCTRSEGQNASRSRSIAAGIAALTDRLNREKSDLTVGEYLRAAKSLWERGGCAPFYKPMDVLAELVDVSP